MCEREREQENGGGGGGVTVNPERCIYTSSVIKKKKSMYHLNII